MSELTQDEFDKAREGFIGMMVGQDAATVWHTKAKLLAVKCNALESETERLRAALENIKGFGDVNLSGEWEHGLRDIIRSMTDCARTALQAHA